MSEINTEKTASPAAMKPLTKKELAALYGVSKPTLIKWLSSLPLKVSHTSRYLFADDLKLIFKRYGDPRSVSNGK